MVHECNVFLPRNNDAHQVTIVTLPGNTELTIIQDVSQNVLVLKRQVLEVLKTIEIDSIGCESDYSELLACFNTETLCESHSAELWNILKRFVFRMFEIGYSYTFMNFPLILII